MDKLYDIKGFEEYQITKSGKVYSKKNKRFLKLDYSTEYPRVKLWDSRLGKTITFLVHRLVAIQFIPNPRNLPYINHKDANKRNPSVYNLEWCTPQYNTQYAYMHGEMHDEELNPNAKLTKDDVFEIYKLSENGKSYKEIAEIFSISANCASDIARGKRWVKTYKEYHNKDSEYVNIPKVFITDNDADYYLYQYWVKGKNTIELEGKFCQTTIGDIVMGRTKKDRFKLFRQEIQKVLDNQQPSSPYWEKVQRLKSAHPDKG